MILGYPTDAMIMESKGQRSRSQGYKVMAFLPKQLKLQSNVTQGECITSPRPPFNVSQKVKGQGHEVQ